MREQTLMIFLVSLLLIGCGDNSTAESSPASDQAEGFDPCELLNEKLVRSHFEIGDAEITSRSSVHSRYATCRVIWPRPDDAKSRAELSFTVPAKRFDSSAQAMSALDSGLDILKNGLKSRPKDPARVALINIQPVEGLGDKAAWTTPNNQMSVANGRRMFHLTVNVYEDSEINRAKAMDLVSGFVKEIR